MQAEFGETAFRPSHKAFGHKLVLAEGPLELNWHHCSVTSEFLGEFFGLHARRHDVDYNEMRHSIGYLSNELLENAIKFRHPGHVRLEAYLENRHFLLKVSNLVSVETAERFQVLLHEVTSRDPGELLIERIEANAEDQSSSGSGLGLLTLMSDYGAKLGWTFTPDSASGAIRLETFAVLELA